MDLPKITTKVSIPHRQSKNGGNITPQPILARFQFLIGSLKTHANEVFLILRVQFQFLIGSLKTNNFLFQLTHPLLRFNSS